MKSTVKITRQRAKCDVVAAHILAAVDMALSVLWLNPYQPIVCWKHYYIGLKMFW